MSFASYIFMCLNAANVLPNLISLRFDTCQSIANKFRQPDEIYLRCFIKHPMGINVV